MEHNTDAGSLLLPTQGDKRGSKWRTASPDRYELLKAFAKENRKFMTEAESIFWQCVRGNALGEKVVRQHIIGDYIVDFLLRRSQIVVEIDGGYHAERQQQEDDAIRQHWLEEHGYRVIRFSNEEVVCDIDNCLKRIKSIVTYE